MLNRSFQYIRTFLYQYLPEYHSNNNILSLGFHRVKDPRMINLFNIFYIYF